MIEASEFSRFLGGLASDRDWPEDFHLENGQYMNLCNKCESTFIGYKRRFVCKLCHSLTTGSQ